MSNPRNTGGRKKGKSRLYNLLKDEELRLKLSLIKIETANFYGSNYVRALDPKVNELLKLVFGSRGDWICREKVYVISLLGDTKWEIVDKSFTTDFMEKFFTADADMKLYGMDKDEVLKAVEQYRKMKEKEKREKK